MPRFVRRHDNGNIEIFSFTATATVGRSRKNDVVLDDQSVSSHHARVDRGAAGWTVADLESRNGTRVNEAEGKTGALKHGDQVKFGKILVTFEMEEAEVAAAPAPAPAAEPSPFAHTMAPMMPPAGLKAPEPPAAPKPAEKSPEAPAAAPKPSAAPRADVAPKPAPAPPAKPAADPPRPPGAAVQLRSEQAELKIRILKEQVRGLQNQRLILMSVAAGLALTTVIFLVAMLMYRTRMLELQHKQGSGDAEESR